MATVTGSLIYQSFLVTDIPRGGKPLVINFGVPIDKDSVVASLTVFDFHYTTGGGFKVQNVHAGPAVGTVTPTDGVVQLTCFCEVRDDDSGHDSRGNLAGYVMAKIV